MTANNKTKGIWDGDVLKRQEVARYLTNYLIKRYSNKRDKEKGFVLALNADWGFGKTFLLKNWAEELRSLNYAAIYFDAWENDFTPEPLVGFIAELDKALKPAFKEIPAAKKLLSQAVNKAKQVWKPLGKAATQIAFKRITAMNPTEFAEFFHAISGDEEEHETRIDKTKEVEEVQKKREQIFEALSKSLESSLKDHNDKRNAISAFKDKLSMLISALEKSNKFQLPVFFFVDELDRCRPNYAIELLEGIKHLFGVPGIYFIVGTNLTQLGESTKALYGTGFDGSRYLKRFFDIEYSLPIPDGDSFAKSLFDSSAIGNSASFITKLSPEIYGHDDQVSKIFSLYARAFGLGLRDQQRVMQHIEATIASMTFPKIHVHYLFFLSMFYFRSPEDFDMLTDRSHNSSTANELVRRHMKNPVSIFYLRPNHDFSRQPASELDLITIPFLYILETKKDLIELEKEHFNSYDFPRILLRELATELPNSRSVNQKYPPSIQRYPQLVRQAGHFS